MLRTDERTLLVDLLTPPEGYRVERAVGSTFTMQLEALLRVPLAVLGAEWRAGADPLGVMEAVRSTADRIDVFCQAGMLAVPAQPSPLHGFLEPVVHQVQRPRPGRLFHPKVWVVSFVSRGGADELRRFRLLCGSRNLTNDRAWDAVVGLDGVETGSPKARNRPLADFLRSLPGRVPGGISNERADGIENLAEGIRRVEWEPPGDLGDVGDDWLSFHFLDAGRGLSIDLENASRRLVISPFINDGGLGRVWPDGSCAIVSRPESFSALDPAYLGRLVGEWGAELFEVDEAAAFPADDEEETDVRWSLRGLHAKVLVLDRGRRSHVFVGSANATSNAWDGNTEFMVELVGPARRVGVKTALADADGSLARILRPAAGSSDSDVNEPTLADLLSWDLVDLAAIPLRAVARLTDDGSWELSISSDAPMPDPFRHGAALSIRPVAEGTISQMVAAGSAVELAWSGLEPEQLTPFVALELVAGPASSPARAGCVVMARLDGAPDDRLDRLIARTVGSPEQFLRFVMLILQLRGGGAEEIAAVGAPLATSQRRGVLGLGMGDGLLESVVHALADHPEAIDEIDALIERLSATDVGRRVLPEELSELWPAVRAAHERTRRERG